MQNIEDIEVVFEIVNDWKKEKVWHEIKLRHERSGGHNGIDIPELKINTGISIDDIKIILIELHNEKKTKSRETKNGRAIYVR